MVTVTYQGVEAVEHLVLEDANVSASEGLVVIVNDYGHAKVIIPISKIYEIVID